MNHNHEFEEEYNKWADKMGWIGYDLNDVNKYRVYDKDEYMQMPNWIMEFLMLVPDCQIHFRTGLHSMNYILDVTDGWMQEFQYQSCYKVHEALNGPYIKIAKTPEPEPEELILDTRYGKRIGKGVKLTSRYDDYTVKAKTYRLFMGVVEGSEVDEQLLSKLIFQIDLRNKGDAFRGPLVDPHSYTKEMHKYYATLDASHSRTYTEILDQLDRNMVIVAPADGLGAISNLWEGVVKAGDMVITPVTQARVMQESITQTLRRAEQGDLIFLGYCGVFLTQEDRDIISAHKGPVIIVDAHFYSIGRSDLSYDIEHSQWYGLRPIRQTVIPPEKIGLKPKPTYCDALLAHRQPLQFLDWGETGEWVRRSVYDVEAVAEKDASLPMLPLPRKGVKYLRVAHSVETLVDKGGPVFFVPTGKIVAGYLEIDDLVGVTHLESRTLYAAEFTLDNESLLRSAHVPHYNHPFEPVLLFWTTPPRMVAEWQTEQGAGTIEFTDRVVYRTEVREDQFIVYASQTLVLDRVSSTMHLGMLLSFAPHYDNAMIRAYTAWMGGPTEVALAGLDALSWREAVRTSSTKSKHGLEKASGKKARRYAKQRKRRKAHT